MTQIFVGNLPYDVTEQDLQHEFECFGRVNSVRIMIDASINRSRGFAFVHMPSFDDADEAIQQMSGSTLNGRQLTVNESQKDHSTTGRQQHGDAARDAALDLFNTLLQE